MQSWSITASARPLIGWLGLRRWLQLPGPAPQPQLSAASARTRVLERSRCPWPWAPIAVSLAIVSWQLPRASQWHREPAFQPWPHITDSWLVMLSRWFFKLTLGQGCCNFFLERINLPSKVALSTVQLRLTVSSSEFSVTHSCWRQSSGTCCGCGIVVQCNIHSCFLPLHNTFRF